MPSKQPVESSIVVMRACHCGFQVSARSPQAVWDALLEHAWYRQSQAGDHHGVTAS
jgi:hypothetical protein